MQAKGKKFHFLVFFILFGAAWRQQGQWSATWVEQGRATSLDLDETASRVKQVLDIRGRQQANSR